MPMYTYRCDQCGEEVEEIRPFSKADDPSDCVKCNAKMRRAITPCGMVWAPTSGGFR